MDPRSARAVTNVWIKVKDPSRTADVASALAAKGLHVVGEPLGNVGMIQGSIDPEQLSALQLADDVEQVVVEAEREYHL